MIQYLQIVEFSTNVFRSADRVSGMVPDDSRYEPFVRPIPFDKLRGPSDRLTARGRRVWQWRQWQLNVEDIGDPRAPIRMLLLHGGGGNAAAMWPFAAHLAAQGAVVTVVDLPGYGRSTSTRPGVVTYQDWQHVAVALATELAGERPLVLVGASMGGMLALDAAALSGVASLVIATCLLDVSNPTVREHIVRTPLLAKVGVPLMPLVVGPLRRIPVPLRAVTAMTRISNDPALTAEVLKDRRGGGGTMPLGWMRSFLESGPAVRAEEYAGPPVVLTHPAEDRWTPLELSASYLARLPVRTRLVELERCGHFPVEEPGFQQLLETVRAEISTLTRG